MLTAFFKLCSEDYFSQTLVYDKVPGGTKLLKKKRQLKVIMTLRKTVALGRVYVVHPNNSNCFHLRILLHVVKGPTSFISLRTFQGIFQGFCKAMYLLEDDTYWESTLSELVLCFSAKSLKYLFVKSLTHIFFGKIIAKA